MIRQGQSSVASVLIGRHLIKCENNFQLGLVLGLATLIEKSKKLVNCRNNCQLGLGLVTLILSSLVNPVGLVTLMKGQR